MAPFSLASDCAGARARHDLDASVVCPSAVTLAVDHDHSDDEETPTPSGSVSAPLSRRRRRSAPVTPSSRSDTPKSIRDASSKTLSEVLDADQPLEPWKVKALVDNVKRKEVSIYRLRWLVLGCLVSMVIFAGVSLSTSWLANWLAQQSTVNAQHELVSANDGASIKAAPTRSFSRLTDLPLQSAEFLEEMRGLTIREDGAVRHYSISGFTLRSSSYLELETTRGRDIVIAAGKAFVRDTSTGKVKSVTTPGSEPVCGSRLGEPSLGDNVSSNGFAVRAYSWSELAGQYHAESGAGVAVVSGGRRWRRLGEDPAEPTGDLYEWFGALISSDVAVADAARGSAREALREAYCEHDTRGLECEAQGNSRNPDPPRLSERGYNRFLLSGGGDLWLLYLDLSDWDPFKAAQRSRRRAVRSKLASGVEGSSGGSVRVTEHWGSETFTYQVVHPLSMPQFYNLSASESDGGLGLAERLLEDEDDRTPHLIEGECKQSSVHDDGTDGDSSSDRVSTAASDVTFDCETGLYLWAISGWRVETSADGTIQAFVFSNASSSEAVGDDDDTAARFRFRVLSVADGGDPRSDFRLARAFERGSIFRGCGGNPDGEAATASRSLTGSGAVLPLSNWCGPGQCGNNYEGCRDNYCLDAFEGDWACRRHDACAKFSNIGPLGSVSACSCDRDLHRNRGSGPNAEVIALAYGPNGLMPCISHEETCTTWGWVPSGRRRRWGWSTWGQTGSESCDNWNYGQFGNKYDDPKLTEFSYFPQIQGFSVESRESWEGCYDNGDDFDVLDPFDL